MLFELWKISIIELAFKNIFFSKMLNDGYFDGSKYISSVSRKEYYSLVLEEISSKYLVLFDKYPENISELKQVWIHNFLDTSDNSEVNRKLTYIESEAIVYWVFRLEKTIAKREEMLKEVLSSYKKMYKISQNSVVSSNVVYNEVKVMPVFIDSLSQFTNEISKLKLEKDSQLLLRGHSNANYDIRPSLYREPGWIRNEDKMFNEILSRCPTYFGELSNSFGKLVEMQHYGLPTRLIDLTLTPNTGLYFACESNFDMHGEVILFCKSKQEIIYQDDSDVTMIANVAKLSHKSKSILTNYEQKTSGEIDQELTKLRIIIQQYNPSFNENIDPQALRGINIVKAIMQNDRIKAQNGAFVLCGLIDLKKTNFNHLRYTEEGKYKVFIIRNSSKRKILSELKQNGIHHAALFPGLESTALYIKEEYK